MSSDMGNKFVALLWLCQLYTQAPWWVWTLEICQVYAVVEAEEARLQLSAKTWQTML